MERKTPWLMGSLLAVVSAVAFATPAVDDEKAQGAGKGPAAAEDRIEEDVPGRPELVKITHIFRDHRNAKARPGPVCICGGDEGASYSLEKVKWFDPAIAFTIYTVNSGTGTLAANMVQAAFDAWKAAEPAAPVPVSTVNDTAPGPGIALDDEQNVSWQLLSETYGSNTLAVTVYWYYRAKTGGFSKVAHFDMAYNTAYDWTPLNAAESCGGGSSFDIRNVGTHEAGHVYGLGHHNGCNLTMNPTAAPGETTKSTLATGDVNGIKAVY